MVSTLEELNCWVAACSRLWLFLDYDGTLADFSASPDRVNLQPEIVALVRQLSCNPRLRVTIISGRKMEAIRDLLPLSVIFLAGVYGVEILAPPGELIYREEYGLIRPFLDKLKPLWETLVTGQTGFFLEDKNWSLALHALAAEVDLARPVLMSARRTAKKILPAGRFRRFASSNFLEIAPLKAHKGKTVRYLLSKFPFSDTQLVYIGDDDKDAEAFQAVHALGGINIQVAHPANSSRFPNADYLLDSPQEVHKWLGKLI